ncbi:MAG: hypothetical protein ACRENE_23345 [Polyangiaceae bacterium]
MSERPKPSEMEVVDALMKTSVEEEEWRMDQEMARVLSLSREEIEAELVADGFDLAEIYAEADALYARLLGKEAAVEMAEAENDLDASKPKP